MNDLLSQVQKRAQPYIYIYFGPPCLTVGLLASYKSQQFSPKCRDLLPLAVVVEFEKGKGLLGTLAVCNIEITAEP